MAKQKRVFVCQECGYEAPKWMGKCPGCGEWNSLVEELAAPQPASVPRGIGMTGHNKPETLHDISVQEEERYGTGMNELDRVLGGGIVRGSLILIGGDPGIGKSTLLLQICNHLGKEGKRVLYISGEESARQIKMRANRLRVSAEGIFLLSETNLDLIMNHVEDVQPDFLVVDSIQTIFRPQMASAPGSVSQVREATAVLMGLAKTTGVAVFIVGHVTKEGAIAGPRVLEHMVDTVLYFEGERHYTYRILRSVKNRFGSTNEIGLFEMRESGLAEILNPSELLLSKRDQDVSGSTVLCTMEGTRPMLVEVQALVSTTAFGMARRMSTGIDYNRVVLLMAVLEKKVGLQLYNQDAYVNVAGGLRIDEPAADLAVVVAIASSFRNVPVRSDLVVMGEVGLTGEVRGISQVEKRIAESAKLGFKVCVIPKDNLKGLKRPQGIEVIGVDSVSETLDILLK